MDLLTERFGKASVLGGVRIVATEIDEQGRILQLTDFQTLTYGELDGRSTPRLEKLDATLRGAGFSAGISNEILHAMWQKWVQIATVGAITCLMRGNIGEVVSIPGGTELSRSALRECTEIASASGHRPSDEFLERQVAQITAQGSQLTSSMYRDLKKGAPTEVDAILGDLLEYGRKHGLTTPFLQAAFVNLSIYQHRRDRAKSANGD
jgi:2-dehydropantoate 2-reductase